MPQIAGAWSGLACAWPCQQRRPCRVCQRVADGAGMAGVGAHCVCFGSPSSWVGGWAGTLSAPWQAWSLQPAAARAGLHGLQEQQTPPACRRTTAASWPAAAGTARPTLSRCGTGPVWYALCPLQHSAASCALQAGPHGSPVSRSGAEAEAGAGQVERRTPRPPSHAACSIAAGLLRPLHRPVPECGVVPGMAGGARGASALC